MLQKMKYAPLGRICSYALVCYAFIAAPAMRAFAAETISEAEAQAIGVEAYLYFYPLVTMDITRKQFTNMAPGREFGKGPMNMFSNIPE